MSHLLTTRALLLGRSVAVGRWSVVAVVSSGLAVAGHAAEGGAPGGNPTPRLHVTGRFLKDPNGRNVTLHGYMQPGASWFNGEGRNYRDPKDFTDLANVAGALGHLKAVADIMSDPAPRYGRDHGWQCRYVRYIADGSAPHNFAPGWDAEGNLARLEQFDGWIRNVLVPYLRHCRSRGLYVVLVGNPSVKYPPGRDGKPDQGRNMSEQYQRNLIAFWTAVASNPDIKGADNVHFEICNEPICIETSFGAGDWGMGRDSYDAAITKFMQPIVDAIRALDAEHVIWIPGLGWQGQYAGFARHPIRGGNVGYAAHLYPAYGGSHDDPVKVADLWKRNYKAAADRWPMIITEMYWTPNSGEGYKNLWNAHTAGFGKAVRSIVDEQGNVSFNIGMIGDLLGNLKGGLASTTLGEGEGAHAAFDWYASYKKAAPAAAVGPAEGVYTVSPSGAAGLAVQVSGSRDAARAVLSRRTGGASQRFRLRALGENRYRLEPQSAPGRCLEFAAGASDSDGALRVSACSDALGQRWIVIALGKGDYRLAPALDPTLTLDRPDARAGADPALRLSAWTDAASQRWRLVRR